MAYNETPTERFIAVLKNRHFQIRYVKDKSKPKETLPDIADISQIDPEKYLPALRELSVDAAKLGFAIYAAKKVLDTACDIAIIAAQAKL